jgi:hypothetical protein
MGIGPTALRLYETLLKNNYLKRGLSVCELGSQDFVPKTYGMWANVIASKSARGFYEYIGMVDYTCIDLNGEHGALRIDLNTAKWNGPRFDVVTNHGTTEHVFNQSNVFRLIHDLTKTGGLMIHVVPSSGYRRHGLFVYGELLFEELQLANNYGRVTCYEEDDRQGTLIVVVLRKVTDAEFALPLQTEYGSSVPERRV